MNYATPAVSDGGNYLFCYFLGNRPYEERVCFALSKDGYHFTPLNGNQPLITQSLGTKCCRDPFIIRGKDCFYIIATDMKSDDGWCSNHGIVTWKSDDLIHWTDETAVDFHMFESTKTADKIWAPQALYDKNKDSYFVYYSVNNTDDDKSLSIWYSYTDDFKHFTEPEELFSPSNGLDAIDADIVEKDGKFYMCYKDECVKTVCEVVADKITGPYRELENNAVTCTDKHVEGNCMYNILGTNSYVMIMDLYVDGGYYMQQTEDMLHFKPVSPDDFSMDFHPRHGSMLHISDEEYDRLLQHFGF